MVPRMPKSGLLSGGALEVWTFMASFGILAMLQQFIPREYIDWLRRTVRRKIQRMTPHIFCDFHEYDNSVDNNLYKDIHVYLSSLTLEGAHRVNMCKTKAERSAIFSLANNEAIDDKFEGAKLNWVHRVSDRSRPQYMNFYENRSEEKRMFTLRINKKDKARILDRYMEQIEARARILRSEVRELRLYTNSKGQDYASRHKRWEAVVFSHPSNFDTLALDGDLKSRIITDLDNFAASENYYLRVGKSWKRGYLLYGPPGTGKSSMIAAIANKMRYDIYDLELTEVESNAQLRKLLIQTTNKSIIVIEDIDCSLDLSGQRKAKAKKVEPPPPAGAPPSKSKNETSQVTLSGLLNFVDGLWSCCGSERIFIFTTNFVEKLDPALLRAGRMDMHIHLSYCTFSAFKVLARNYLDVEDHEMFDKVERAFPGSYMTPAAVSEVLIQNQDEDASVVLQRLIEALGEHREDPAAKAAEEELKEAEQAKLEEEALAEAKALQKEAKELRKEAKEKEEELKEEKIEKRIEPPQVKKRQAKSGKGSQVKSEEKREPAESCADLGRINPNGNNELKVQDGWNQKAPDIVDRSDDCKSTDPAGGIKPAAKTPKLGSRNSGKIVPLDESETQQEQLSSTNNPSEKLDPKATISAMDETRQVTATEDAIAVAKC